jgi:hypothetical protein
VRNQCFGKCHGKCRSSAMNPRPRCLPPVLSFACGIDCSIDCSATDLFTLLSTTPLLNLTTKSLRNCLPRAFVHTTSSSTPPGLPFPPDFLFAFKFSSQTFPCGLWLHFMVRCNLSLHDECLFSVLQLKTTFSSGTRLSCSVPRLDTSSSGHSFFPSAPRLNLTDKRRRR